MAQEPRRGWSGSSNQLQPLQVPHPVVRLQHLCAQTGPGVLGVGALPLVFGEGAHAVATEAGEGTGSGNWASGCAETETAGGLLARVGDDSKAFG